MILIGIDFHQSPIQLREYYAIPPSKQDLFVTALKKHFDAQGILILNTCNRTEIYLSHTNASTSQDKLIKCWQAHTDSDEILSSPLSALATHTYYMSNTQEILTHLLHVACGLKSMVLGESEIFGQLKKAYQNSQDSAIVTSEMHQLLQFVFTTTKQIRHATKINQCPISIAFSAAKLANNITHIKDKKILIIGAGDTAKLIAQHLQNFEPQKITLINRTIENANIVVQHLNLIKIHTDDLSNLKTHLNASDVIVCAIHSTSPLISSTLLSQLPQTAHKLFIDLSVPRAIQNNTPANCKESHPHFHFVNVDHIHETLSQHKLKRQEAAIQANTMIQASIQTYQKRHDKYDAYQTIAAIKNKMNDIIHNELEKYFKHLSNTNHNQTIEETLTHFASSLQKKWLHEPFTALKTDDPTQQKLLLEASKHLFKLH